jgi:Ca2+-binding EF-hand superfamily protein
MGNKPPKLPKEDVEHLTKCTNFTEAQIKQWYKGFMVGVQMNFISLNSSTTILVRVEMHEVGFC